MASICDFTGPAGMVTRDQAEAGVIAYNNGELSRSAAVALVSAYEDGSGIGRCGASGGDELGIDPELVSITSCTKPSPATISAGETTTLKAELANGNNRAVEVSVRFQSGGGGAVDTTTVAAGRTGKVSAGVRIDEPGEYQFEAVKNSVVPL